MMTMKLNDKFLIALFGGLFSDKIVSEAKADLPQGEKVKGELIVRIPYTLSKGIDYDAKPTANLLSQAVLAKTIAYSGITGKAFKAALLKAATEALLNKDASVAQVLSKEDERVVTIMQEVQDEIVAKLERQPRNGRTTIKVTTEDGLPEVMKSVMEVVA